MNPSCHTSMKFTYQCNLDLENLTEFNILRNLHLCTQKSVWATDFRSFRKMGANFFLQLSSPTQFAKIKNKKLINDNKCEKHNNSSLGISKTIFIWYLLKPSIVWYLKSSIIRYLKKSSIIRYLKSSIIRYLNQLLLGISKTIIIWYLLKPSIVWYLKIKYFLYLKEAA